MIDIFNVLFNFLLYEENLFIPNWRHAFSICFVAKNNLQIYLRKFLSAVYETI